MILSNGKVVAQDSPSNLVKDINAKNAYFGEVLKLINNNVWIYNNKKRYPDIINQFLLVEIKA